MRYLLILIITLNFAFASSLKEYTWKENETFLTFLESKKIPQSLYFNLERQDQELATEIQAGVKYYTLENEETNELEQVLIPISEEIQLHLYKNNGKFVFTTTPILFDEIIQSIAIPISNSPYQDILEATSNKTLADEFIRSFSGLADFKRMRKGDYIAIKYTQRLRLGQYYGTPVIHSALIEVYKNKAYLFKYEKDGLYYNQKGENLTSFFMRTPVKYTRISSKFSLNRWHPILKRYRPHFGIDYAAPRGRPVVATASGRIISRGVKGGYGKAVEIAHEGGYKSLYAHMSGFSKLQKGQRVKQGDVVGYVGNTGLSSGPHLHFGLYKNGKAINPASVIRVAKNNLKGKEKEEFISYAEEQIQHLLTTIKDKPKPLNITVNKGTKTSIDKKISLL